MGCIMKSSYFLLIVLLAIIFPGCSIEDSSSEKNQPVKKPKSDSIANTIAEEVTGYRVLKQGRQMQDKIHTVSEQHNKELNAILKEDK